MWKKICLLSCLLGFSLGFKAQDTISAMEQAILKLKTPQAIADYWNKLHERDQAVRGKVNREQRLSDQENMKAMLLMLKHYGYPTGFCYGCGLGDLNNFTPNIIMVHNRVRSVNEFIFPIIKRAYDEGLVNKFWYLHSIWGMARARYGRDLYEKKEENIPLFHEKLAPYTGKAVNYDVSVIDSLFQQEDAAMEMILKSDLIFEKKKDRIRHYVYKTTAGNLYWHRVYPDDSFFFPQQIYFNAEKREFCYGIDNAVITHEVIVKNKDKLVAKIK